MVTPQEKAQCVSWFIETKSDVQTQRSYWAKNGKDPPSRSSICRWHKNFMETGSVLDAVRSGRPRTSAENIERVRQAFSRSPVKSIRTAARELELLPCSELITANRLYSCFYLSLHSLPQFFTLCFARCSLGSQRPPVRCITFVYCHDNRHVITSYFFIFCLYCLFVVSLPANRWLIAPSRPVA